MAIKCPIIFYGTTTFGSSHVPALQDPTFASQFLDSVRSTGISQIDTAARYPPDNHGGSERMLGAIHASDKGFTINTKILFAGQNSDGTLSKEAVRRSVASSLKRLNIDKIGILYAHCPDNATPLEEQAEALSEQQLLGNCAQYGVSNFPVNMLERFLDICVERGYPLPSVYQGQYNLICRGPEKELIPLLRKHNMSFNAYSPLGGGFLTGNLTTGNAAGTRLGSAYGAHFTEMYDHPEFHEAIRSLLKVVEPLGIKPTEAALRWIAYHSVLNEADGIILGASKPDQLLANMEDIHKGPLPQVVVDEIMKIGRKVDEMGGGDFEIKPSKLPPK
ncbi:putative aldo/keto reductase [Xylaria flabelliformis]|nr:putative aldo/keto reductase [Xylaria flabelliformis]